MIIAITLYHSALDMATIYWFTTVYMCVCFVYSITNMTMSDDIYM